MAIFWPTPTQRPLLKENEHYCFSEIIVGDEYLNAVKILTGPFAKVEFYYGHVKVVPEHGSHRLAFQYTIWDSAGLPKTQIQTPEFMAHLGDILVAIIADEHNKGEYAEPSRAHDSEESHL